MSTALVVPRIFQPGDAFRQYPYVVESFLGAGASGQVYALRHKFTGDRFALKVSHLADQSSAKKVARSLQEARATYGIRHHNVVRVLDLACEDDGMVWQLMELLEGKTVAELLARTGKLSPLYAIDVALEVTCGLQAAHEQQIIHRDVQPSNIFVTSAGVVKVLDFSLAKVIPAQLKTTLTEHAMGTAGYISPEQLRRETPTPQFDVYGLGMVLWEMLAGRHPFHEARGHVPTMVNMQLGVDPGSLAVEIGLPAYCDEVIRGATAKDPARRYDGMWSLRRALTDLRARLAGDPEAEVLVRDVPAWERRAPIATDPDGQKQYGPPRSIPGGVDAPAMPSARIVVPGAVALDVAVPAASAPASNVPAAGVPAAGGPAAGGPAGGPAVGATPEMPARAKHVVAVTMPMQAVAAPVSAAPATLASAAPAAAPVVTPAAPSAPAMVEPSAPASAMAAPSAPASAMAAPSVPSVVVPASSASGARGETPSLVDVAAPTLRAPKASRRRWWLLLVAVPVVLAAGVGVWLLVTDAPSGGTSPSATATAAAPKASATSAPKRPTRPKK